MDARAHALEILAPVDPRAGMQIVAERLLEAAAEDDSIIEKFAAIRSTINNTVIVGDPHMAIYNRLRSPQAVLDVPAAPEWMRAIFTVAYLRARAVIASGAASSVIHNFTKSLDRAVELLDFVRSESDFAGELLVETTMRMRDDKEFARTIRAGAAELRALSEHIYGKYDGTTPEGELSGAPKALARMQSGGGGDGCTCCTNTNGTTECEPCSCWIIVIIIIVIVVTK
jgi:hypothetical protein